MGDPTRVTRHLISDSATEPERGRLFILAIDASGSMAINRIRQAKGAALSLLKQSYIKRDRVAIVGFRVHQLKCCYRRQEQLRARRFLDALTVGAERRLPAGLLCSLELVKQDRSESEIVLLVSLTATPNVRHDQTECIRL